MLPINQPTIYEVTIPSTGKKCQFRPFIVKEQKALLLAQQSEDVLNMYNTLKEVINACTLNKIDTEKLSTFDVEFLFCQIRGKSVGEFVELKFQCRNIATCDGSINVRIDVTKIPVVKQPNHTNKIPLFKDVGVVMKYPGLNTIKDLEKQEDKGLSLILSSIDYIYDGDQVYHAKEATKEELTAFIENLTTQQFNKIQEFFSTMPKLQQKIEFTCPVCSSKQEKVVEGIQNFF